MEEDYLSNSEEEINEEFDIPPPDKERDLDTEKWTEDHSKGIHFPGEEEFTQAINDIKDLVHEEFFQNGSREKVHNMSVIEEYIKFLGIIYDFLKYTFKSKQPVDSRLFNIGLSEQMIEGLRNFFQIAHAQAQNELTADQVKHRANAIKLQFIDYPYCHRKECLSMD